MNLLKISLFLAATLATKGADLGGSNDDHRWIAPKATDVRSPCPGLNTYADPVTFQL
jgi:hypothetical protein